MQLKCLNFAEKYIMDINVLLFLRIVFEMKRIIYFQEIGLIGNLAGRMALVGAR